MTAGQERSWLDILHHLILPAAILGLNYVATFVRYTRSSMLEVIRTDYVTTARAKGLTEFTVIIFHALRNALLPLVTIIGLSLPNLFVGAVFIETIFTWPGMGTLFIDGVNSRDFPLIMGIILITATAVLLANLITDITYALIDPEFAMNNPTDQALDTNQQATAKPATLQGIRTQVESPGKRAWRQFRRHKLAIAGSLMLLVIVILAVGAPLFTPYDPNEVNLRQITEPPNSANILGTDRTGA